jgi:hypothetical protein
MSNELLIGIAVGENQIFVVTCSVSYPIDAKSAIHSISILICHTTPWSITAPATLTFPAIVAPLTSLPGVTSRHVRPVEFKCAKGDEMINDQLEDFSGASNVEPWLCLIQKDNGALERRKPSPVSMEEGSRQQGIKL